jgi:hypothetical protein
MSLTRKRNCIHFFDILLYNFKKKIYFCNSQSIYCDELNFQKGFCFIDAAKNDQKEHNTIKDK